MTAAAAAAAPLPAFEEFFRALWSQEPFPWQTMLAALVMAEGWPEVIDLPTAAGKTACMDIALYALAAQAEPAPEERRAPRRIWFVVDRRIVVDAAFARARDIAKKLSGAADGPLAALAARLRRLTSGPEPLAVARLRGGIWRDDAWASLPSQPAVICSTVDQLGSALLFRAYGHRPNTAAMWAGLAANDSLILLDEAHCARPFSETLGAIRRFRQPPWCAQSPLAPFHAVVMSATHRVAGEAGQGRVFPAPDKRAAALDSEKLRERVGAAKPAELRPPVKGDQSAFAAQLAAAAAGFRNAGRQRIAVMVNRVATAQEAAKNLGERLGHQADVVLLTGRMRPLDRDDLVTAWQPKLRAQDRFPPEVGKSVVVVTTQCLEVGADFDFDALVTECASLDALRQRFGRLNRLGSAPNCAAAILIQEADVNAKSPDPIYGAALAATWKWLKETGGAGNHADFGIAAMDQALARLRENDSGREATLYPPVGHAPVLLPAHLDMLCQTGPRPAVAPEPALFLHGPQVAPPEARVIWRAGLCPEQQRDAEKQWTESLDLLPPSGLEALTVPVYRLRRWLEGREAPDEGGDVEGAAGPEEETAGAAAAQPAASAQPFGLWRWDRANGAALAITADPSAIRPGDTIILRAARGRGNGLGQLSENGLGPGRLDLAERAARTARGRVVLRLQPDVLAPWRDRPEIRALLAMAEDQENPPDTGDLEAALRAASQEPSETPEITDKNGAPLPPLPAWLPAHLRDLAHGLRRPEPLPGGGLLLTAKKPCRPGAAGEDEDGDAETGSSRGADPVTLRAHTAAVCRAVAAQAARCLREGAPAALSWAAERHDLGKLDRRFQLLLQNGEPSDGEPLAKSPRIPRRSRRRAVAAPEDALPQGFRHEMLSLAIAQAQEPALAPELHDLALHLIASHHGHARPFAPVVMDAAPDAAEIAAALAAYFPAAGAAPVLDPVPAHHLASGVADRFWRLTRRYGWWGLAYLEAILRFADWQASGDPTSAGQPDSAGAAPPSAPAIWAAPRPAPPRAEIELTAIDGANPLGFLAALGVLRLVHLAPPGDAVRLHWTRQEVVWRPHLSGLPSAEDLLQILAAAPWAPAEKMTAALGKDLTVTPETFRAFAVAAPADRLLAAFAAAFGSEACTEERTGRIERTPFCFITGSGHQHFLGTIGELAKCVTADHLKDALFGPWRREKGKSMRWDPSDAAEYALRASEPGPEGAAAAWGANRLAIEALPLFATAPARRASARLATAAWTKEPETFTWPLWTTPIGCDAAAALLNHADLAQPGPSRGALRSVGISQIFCARRVRIGSGANFKISFRPARAI